MVGAFRSFSTRGPGRAPFVAGLVSMALGVLAVAPAAAAAFSPEDFDVNADMGEPSTTAPEIECSTGSDGREVCTGTVRGELNGHESTGTVRHASSGLEGSIEIVCDMEFEVTLAFIAPTSEGMQPEFTSADGSGWVSCGWHMEFGDGSTLTGELDGRMTMELLDAAAQTALMRLHFTVNVVDGTGEFADQVGTGTFDEEEVITLGDEPGSDGGSGGGPGGGGPGAGGAAAFAARTGALGGDPNMNLKLRKGKRRGEIVWPGKRLDKKSKTPLHAVTVPGARCKGTARKGGKRVGLGRAKANANGSVRFRGKLAGKLGSGRWGLSVSCSYRDSERGSGKVRATSSVRIA